jgi:hypothetical protein
MLRDGSLYIYPDCPPSLNKPCTLSMYRDAEGHTVRMRHDRRMNAVQIQSDQGSTIDLTYDDLIRNGFDSAGRCILNDARIETVDRAGRPRVSRYLYTFAYTVNASGKITATEVQRPSSRRKVTFNAQGYSPSDTVEGGTTREFGTAFEREAGSNVVPAVDALVRHTQGDDTP